MVFDPHLEVVKVAPHLCICENCMENYGSCPLFQSLDLRSITKLQNKRCLRRDLDDSDNENEDNDEIPDDEREEIITDYFSANTVCAVAADRNSIEMFYFIFIEGSCEAEFDHTDDYNHSVVAGQKYLSWFYLEKHSENSRGVTYTLNLRNNVYFYPESIVFPFVNFQMNAKGKKNTMFLSSYDYYDLLKFVEQNKMSTIV